jgi:hypothetical protein
MYTTGAERECGGVRDLPRGRIPHPRLQLFEPLAPEPYTLYPQPEEREPSLELRRRIVNLRRPERIRNEGSTGPKRLQLHNRCAHKMRWGMGPTTRTWRTSRSAFRLPPLSPVRGFAVQGRGLRVWEVGFRVGKCYVIAGSVVRGVEGFEDRGL